ncbi:MAG: sodium:solute symporter family protein [Oscillospiraceae bacterium]
MYITIITIVYLVLLFGVCALAQKRQDRIVAAGGKGSTLMSGKNLPLILVIMLTAGGSIGSATTTGVAQLVQTAGVSAIWYPLANILGLLFLGIVGAKRMRRLGYSTNNEMVADYCGKGSRYLMVVGQLIILLGVGCLQYVSGGAMLSAMFPGQISYELGILITAVVFTIVCLVGGLYGTSLSNLINVIVIYLGIFLCAIAAVSGVGGWDALMSGMDQVAAAETTTYGGSWLSLTGGLGLAACLSYVVSEPGNRITTQSNTAAVAAARDEKTARNGLIIGALLLLPVCIASVVIGLVAKVQYPDILSAQAFSVVLLNLHPALAALGMVGLWAVTVSTGIVLLMAAVQVFCYDIMAPINLRRADPDPIRQKKKMNIQTKIITVILSAVMLFCAYKATGIVSTIITVLCITPAFFWIMLSFLYWPKLIKKHSALITQIVAYIFFVVWLFVPAVKAAIPTPIYVEWPLCTVVWFLCYFLDREPIDKVVPKSERKLSAGILADE